MNISSKGLERIIAHEGEVLQVYLDPIGLPTLGVGHLLTRTELKEYPVGTKISKQLSRDFLRKDLARFERAINDLVKVPLTQNQYDALVSLAFNIGVGAFRRSTLLKKLNSKDYNGAAAAFHSWVKAGGKVLPGLQKRRKAEAKLFLTPDAKPAVSADPIPAPAGDSEETQTNNSSPSPSTQTGTLSKVIEVGLQWADKVVDTETRVSKSSWLAALVARATAIVALAVAFLVDNWEIILIGIALLLLAGTLVFLSKRKTRKAN